MNHCGNFESRFIHDAVDESPTEDRNFANPRIPKLGDDPPFPWRPAKFLWGGVQKVDDPLSLPRRIELDVLADISDLEDGLGGPANLRYFTHF